MTYTIKNSTNFDCEINYNGVVYKVNALSSLSGLSKDVAFHWVKNIHQFLVLSEDKDKVKEVIASIEVEDKVKPEVVIKSTARITKK